MATVKHYDPQQCPPLVDPTYAEPHSHPVCECDPDAVKDPDALHISMWHVVVEDGEPKLRVGTQAWNTRAHIKQELDGHWPLTAEQTVVICERCGGGIEKTPTHKAALSHQGL